MVESTSRIYPGQWPMIHVLITQKMIRFLKASREVERSESVDNTIKEGDFKSEFRP